jgi:hypothetical protein
LLGPGATVFFGGIVKGFGGSSGSTWSGDGSEHNMTKVKYEKKVAWPSCGTIVKAPLIMSVM